MLPILGLAFAVGLLAWPSLEANPPKVPGLSVDDCVRAALAGGRELAGARTRLAEWRARIAEVQANMYAQLTASAPNAPSLRGPGRPRPQDADRGGLTWAPFLRLGASGPTSVDDDDAVLHARNTLAAEVRRYYFLHLCARTLRPTLAYGRKALGDAQEAARRSLGASKDALHLDLRKLGYGASTLEIYRLQAEVGEGLASSALAHLMGIPSDAPPKLAADALPLPPAALEPLADHLARASLNWPGWAAWPDDRRDAHGAEIRRAWEAVGSALQLARASSAASLAARQCLTFAGEELARGSGESRDVLEGLIAYLQARQAELEAVRDAHLAFAQLDLACGSDGLA